MKKLCLLFHVGMLLICAAICAISTAFFMPKIPALCTVKAESATQYSGQYGGVTWTLNAYTGALFIDGTGEIADISAPEDTTAWRAHNELIQSLVIADTITAIGKNAFAKMDNLCEVTIGAGVTKIGVSAFRECPSLNRVTIPASVQTIDKYAFKDSGVQKLTLSEGLQSIEKEAFRGCKNLQAVHISNSVTQLATKSFYDCTALQTVAIGNGVTEIALETFYNCTALQTLDLGDGVQTVGENAFYNCNALTSLRIGDSVQTIGKNAFYGCEKLPELHLSDSVTTLCQHAFYGAKSLRSLHIGAGLTTIENNAFVFTNADQRFDVVYVHAPAVASGLSDETAFNHLAGHVFTLAVKDGLQTHAFIKEKFVQKEDISYKQTAYQVYTKLGHNHHDWRPYEIASPSCTVAGFQGEICADCRLIKGEETFAHTYVYQPTDMQTHLQICSACGEQQSIVHAWDTGEQTLSPTHTATGRMQYTCRQCNAVDIQTLPLLPDHEFGEWQTQVPATCTAQGKQTRTCPCGEEQTQSVAATGHYYQSTETPPTCTEGGYITHVCAWCNHTYQDHCYAPSGHTYTDQNDLSCNVCNATREPLPDHSTDSDDDNANTEPDNNQTPDNNDTPENNETPDNGTNNDAPETQDNAHTDVQGSASAQPLQTAVDMTAYQKTLEKSAQKSAVIGAITATGTTAVFCVGWYALSATVRRIKKNRRDEWADEELDK